MNKARISTIIEGLQNLPEHLFNFKFVKSECGTIGCILGHMETFFPSEFEYKPTFDKTNFYPVHKSDGHIEDFLGIDYEELTFLTEPNHPIRSEYFKEINIDLVNIGDNATTHELINVWNHYRDNRDQVRNYIDTYFDEITEEERENLF